ncbi:hypothetical protein FSP39_017765 [Pinctada imbricata]|uniref:Uncharacterized protein n=1 Tax=Pinctada imbricata TaxID=66713 RepID=A0AA89CCU1_PINIB|nr:hypothetical protein FSP39_017765 [Pinctada imbricata]
MEDLQIGIGCMVVECLKGSKSYVPRDCFEPAAAACEYDTYLNARMTQRAMKKKCLDEEKYLASINDDLCQRGYIKNTSYWINPERHVYEAPDNHTGGKPEKIYGPVLGVVLIMCTVVVTLFIIQKRRKYHSKNREMDGYGENKHTDINVIPKSKVKNTKTFATNNSKNYSSPMPRESGIYEEQDDGIYDKMNSTREKKGNEYAENNIYNEASYPDDSNVYNTSTGTTQLSSNISCDTEYGYGKIEKME